MAALTSIQKRAGGKCPDPEIEPLKDPVVTAARSIGNDSSGADCDRKRGALAAKLLLTVGSTSAKSLARTLAKNDGDQFPNSLLAFTKSMEKLRARNVCADDLPSTPVAAAMLDAAGQLFFATAQCATVTSEELQALPDNELHRYLALLESEGYTDLREATVCPHPSSIASPEDLIGLAATYASNSSPAVLHLVSVPPAQTYLLVRREPDGAVTLFNETGGVTIDELGKPSLLPPPNDLAARARSDEGDLIPASECKTFRREAWGCVFDFCVKWHDYPLGGQVPTSPCYALGKCLLLHDPLKCVTGVTGTLSQLITTQCDLKSRGCFDGVDPECSPQGVCTVNGGCKLKTRAKEGEPCSGQGGQYPYCVGSSGYIQEAVCSNTRCFQVPEVECIYGCCGPAGSARCLRDGEKCVLPPKGKPCGNKALDPGEACDGSSDGGPQRCPRDQCRTDCTCPAFFCGDGRISPLPPYNEQCDDGINIGQCKPCHNCKCTCGNEHLDPGEACDASSSEEPQACPAEHCKNCTCEPFCGDTKCTGDESCTSCPEDCGACPATCGNEHLDAGEACDASTTEGPQACVAQSCSENCTCEACPSGIVDKTGACCALAQGCAQDETPQDGQCCRPAPIPAACDADESWDNGQCCHPVKDCQPAESNVHGRCTPWVVYRVNHLLTPPGSRVPAGRKLLPRDMVNLPFANGGPGWSNESHFIATVTSGGGVLSQSGIEFAGTLPGIGGSSQQAYMSTCVAEGSPLLHFRREDVGEVQYDATYDTRWSGLVSHGNRIDGLRGEFHDGPVEGGTHGIRPCCRSFPYTLAEYSPTTPEWHGYPDVKFNCIGLAGHVYDVGPTANAKQSITAIGGPFDIDVHGTVMLDVVVDQCPVQLWRPAVQTGTADNEHSVNSPARIGR